jgi:hypothetical protein
MGAAVLARPVRAQQQDLERFERNLEQIRRDTLLSINPDMSLDQRVMFDYGAYVTFGYLSLDDNNNDNHVLRQAEILPYARLNLDGAQELFLRGRWGYRDFNAGDSFDGRGDEPIDGDLDRGYYAFDLQRYMAAYHKQRIDYDIGIKLGRDLAYWGNGLVLSEVLDGGVVDLTWRKTTLSIVAGITPVRTVDFDASRPNFESNTRREFYGAILTQNVGGHRPFVYGLVQRDDNSDDLLTTGPVTTRFDYNSYYFGAGASGPLTDRLLYRVEAAYEGGDTLSNSFVIGGPFLTPVPQTRDDIQAWAADGRIDYLLNDPRHSRLSAEVILASGDSDRLNTSNTFAGNKPDTKDHAFNAFGLLNTGLAFAPSVSNIMAFRVGGSTFPLPDVSVLRRMQVGTDLFIFNKMQSHAPVDEFTNDTGYLGIEPDVSLNWQITSDVTLAVRYGIFFPNGDAFRSDEQRQFIYAGVTYAF